MTLKTKPFWETNVNPITMFATSTSQPSRAKNSEKYRRIYATVEELDGCISGKSLMAEFSIGAKKVKALFAIMGEEPKYNKGNSYYNTQYLDKVREMVADTVETKIDMSQYITNQQLMKMFDFNYYKAWDIATKAKLVKIKLSGNIAYYNREKAIEAFAKYQK